MQVVTHTAAWKSFFRSWVIACVQPIGFFLVPVLPILVREMKNLLSPVGEGERARALDGVSLFNRYSDFKMSLFHFNLYFGLTTKINLHVRYIAIKNYFCFDNHKM